MIEKAYRRIMEENRVDAALLQNTIEVMKLEEGRLFEKDGARVKKGKPSFGRGLRLGTIGVAAVFLLLFGVNAAFPAFAESIPGLGSIFTLLNGRGEIGSQIGTYEALIEQVNTKAAAAADSGYGLTVSEAFCDGKYLYTALRFSCPEEAEQYEKLALAHTASRDTGEVEQELTVKINGTEAKVLSALEDGQSISKGQCAMALVAALPEEAAAGERLEVSLRVGALYGCYPGYQYVNGPEDDIIPTGFTADYSVGVDLSANRDRELFAEDNGVRLYRIASTPGYALVELELPFWGRESDTLLSDNRAIIGQVYLYDEAGNQLRGSSALSDYDFNNEEECGSIRGTWVFDGPPAENQKLTLRVLEYGLDRAPQDERRQEKPGLFAEFTIDPVRGTAAASQSYQQEGYRWLDTQDYIASPKHPDFTGGYLITGVRGYNLPGSPWTDRVTLLTDVESPQVEARFYRDNELLGAVSPSRRVDVSSNTGGAAKWLLEFSFAYGEETISTDYTCGPLKCDRIDLVNPETGEVLLEDLYAGDVYRP